MRPDAPSPAHNPPLAMVASLMQPASASGRARRALGRLLARHRAAHRSTHRGTPVWVGPACRLTAPLTRLASWLPGRRLAQRRVGLTRSCRRYGPRPRTREMARTRCSVWPTGLAATDDEGPCPVPGRYLLQPQQESDDGSIRRSTDGVGHGTRDFLRRRSGNENTCSVEDRQGKRAERAPAKQQQRQRPYDPNWRGPPSHGGGGA